MRQSIFLPFKDYSKHRLIYCICPGRSGSGYLAELIGTAERVSSYHEPEPTMSRGFVQMVNERPYSDTYSARYGKVDATKQKLNRLPKGQVYCETSHMFIKTFFDVITEAFQEIEVVILRRDMGLVLKSFIELGYFSSKNDEWRYWMTSPNARTAALPCIDVDSNLDQFDLCIAYLLDVEARGLRFQSEYPTVRTHPIYLERLNHIDVVEGLFSALSITTTDKTAEVVGRVVNARKEKKKYYDNSTDLAYCRKRIELYVEKANSLGIELPTTLLHLDSLHS